MKYALMMLLAALTGVHAVALELNELLIVGDGMTKNAPMPELGWKGNWGMAATSEDKDYAHLLIKKINAVFPKARLVLDNIMYEDIMTANSADVIIIQLGDNYKGGVPPAEYQAAYQQMIGELRGDTKKLVICIGPWNNQALEPYIEKAAKAADAKFVSLSKIASAPANRAAADGMFPLLDKQPGDQGMRLIAEAIWAILTAELNQIITQLKINKRI